MGSRYIIVKSSAVTAQARSFREVLSGPETAQLGRAPRVAQGLNPGSVDQRSGALLWEASLDLGSFLSRPGRGEDLVRIEELGLRS